MINLTDRGVKSLKTFKREESFYDQKTPGFGVRAYLSGRKSYFLLYTNHLGRQRWYTIGDVAVISLADARKEAIKVKAQVAAGIDPAEKKTAQKKTDTVGELAERFLLHCREHNRTRTVTEYERQLRREILPGWALYKVDAIKPADVISLVDSIKSRGAGILANRVQSLISSLFAFAKDRRLIEVNPAQGLRKPTKAHSRDRVLSDDEIKALFDSFESCHRPALSLCIKLILLTGVRPGEAEGATWAEIDLEKKLWTIPAERTKGGKRPHVVPLLSKLDSLLLEARHRAVSVHGENVRHVFPRMTTDTPQAVTKAFRKLIGAPAGFTFTPHDLRRTVATRLQQLGEMHETIEMILGHAVPGVAGIYHRGDRARQVETALGRWHRQIEQIITGDTAQLLHFPLPRVANAKQ